MRAWGFRLRHNNLSRLTGLGDRHLDRLQFSHVAGFVGVPWPATGLQAGSSGRARKSNHANQHEHVASDKQSAMREDSLHAFVEEFPKRALTTPIYNTTIRHATWQAASYCPEPALPVPLFSNPRLGFLGLFLPSFGLLLGSFTPKTGSF